MKKITLLLGVVCFYFGANAQIFTDDFESYSVGQYIGPASTYWTTWSGAEGGAEDVQATNVQANSGANSIYFSSTAPSGGPQDVVLDFGMQYTSGTFVYESEFYVEAGKNAYFNFQATPVIGTTWAMNCNMDGGIISIDDGVTPNLAVGSYTDATWFNLRIEANLSLGRWQAFVDGVCIGVWANSINELASLDLYPVTNSGFYVDDVMFDHTAYSPSTLNAAVAGFMMGGNIAGLNVKPTVTVVNGGSTTITSFDVTVNYNGSNYTENVTGVSLTAGQSMAVVYTNPIMLVAGNMSATATVSNVNGGTDDDATDDDGCAVVDPVVPASGKVVVGEEATGTWCGWCPRGAVYMDMFEQDFGPFWAGIAVHNGDPMADAVYDAGVGTYISGYPSALVDRGAAVDPSAMSNNFYTRLQTAPTALISNSATYNASTGVLEVTVTADFQMAANSSWKLACAITEDDVTGTTAGYNQTNYYAGGTNGVMGGYELLPSPVPAAQMVYDHVARGIQPSFTGDATVFPATVSPGSSYSGTYTFTIDPTWDINNIHIIGMLLDPTGMIDNAGKSMVPGVTELGEVTEPAKTFSIYPNPTNDAATIGFVLENDAEVALRIVDMSGKEMASRDYGVVTTTSTIQLNTSGYNSGIYLVELTIDGYKMTKRLVIE